MLSRARLDGVSSDFVDVLRLEGSGQCGSERMAGEIWRGIGGAWGTGRRGSWVGHEESEEEKK